MENKEGKNEPKGVERKSWGDGTGVMCMDLCEAVQRLPWLPSSS